MADDEEQSGLFTEASSSSAAGAVDVSSSLSFERSAGGVSLAREPSPVTAPVPVTEPAAAELLDADSPEDVPVAERQQQADRQVTQVEQMEAAAQTHSAAQVEAGAQADSTSQMVMELRTRLAQALNDMAVCRQALAHAKIPHQGTMSCRPEDHDDVLCGLRAEASIAPDVGQVPEAALMGAETPRSQSSSSRQPLSPSAKVQAHASALEEATAGAAGTVERLEEELSMAKALLLLNNVKLNVDIDKQSPGASGSASGGEALTLKANLPLVQQLIVLKQKVSLMKQQYLLLRGDMLYLGHEMHICRHWVMQSFRMAMAHQSQEQNSLQTRFERLSKVLN
mmetsp:Transcript_25652/g.59772  ORF Transcript_25652/g.59772 Transcript_25652/m.59772 type:complete len:339 (-) Transcript_25652:163-1179(-)